MEHTGHHISWSTDASTFQHKIHFYWVLNDRTYWNRIRIWIVTVVSWQLFIFVIHGNPFYTKCSQKIKEKLNIVPKNTFFTFWNWKCLRQILYLGKSKGIYGCRYKNYIDAFTTFFFLFQIFGAPYLINKTTQFRGALDTVQIPQGPYWTQCFSVVNPCAVLFVDLFALFEMTISFCILWCALQFWVDVYAVSSG